MSRGLVRVYNGLGISEESISMLWKSLHQILGGSGYGVEYITPQEIIKGALVKENTALLAIGGGYDLGFTEALGSEGVRSIRDFVGGGGSYLGLCAGAYFACDGVEFDRGGPLEVCGERALKLYSGKCIGPVLPGFKYNSNVGAHALRISWLPSTLLPRPPKDFSCYYNGGGHFTPPTTPNCRPLALYEGVKGTPAAIVHCTVGQGKAVLCGTHPEYLVEELDGEDPDLEKVSPILEENREECRNALAVMLELLGLARTFVNVEC